ncbi:MAG: hypothetical protein JJ868_06885 [Shimia sp.]|uniref:hypothetical protein n=1 Tax=Shimia sp. TaxID=1954381 RepID=UPI001B061787|nr:hypothetical protein [Shimia sp.]MBO6897083.1 hypothetical protein [Shimia sp.]
MPKDKDGTLSVLQKAVRQKDPDKFEDALNACFPMQFREGLCDLLADVLNADWHFRHEDVAHAIQTLTCACAVEALERRALNSPEYLAWDEDHALARKCTWALADIGTDEAKQALERLSLSEITVVRGFAQKRIDKWQDELARKGTGLRQRPNSILSFFGLKTRLWPWS